MAIYVIGDIHGCFDELQLLLDKIEFNRTKDILWFTGDLVNGSDKSIETIQFVKNLGTTAICVLGNHDLTFLGATMGKIDRSKLKNTWLETIKTTSIKEELLTWLLHRPLIHYDPDLNILLVHAGLAPQWDLLKAMTLAKEVEFCLRSSQAPEFFANMFGEKPDIWDDKLTDYERLRCITNYLTRLRFCSKDGLMNLLEKGPAQQAPKNMLPWYEVPNRQTTNTKIIFGHWAALVGKTSENNVIALDTGCVWGNYLTALRLEDNQKFTVQRILY